MRVFTVYSFIVPFFVVANKYLLTYLPALSVRTIVYCIGFGSVSSQ